MHCSSIIGDSKVNPSKRRLVLHLAVLMLLLLTTAVSGDGRPNSVLIMADDMGNSDLGCYGSEIETPSIV